MVKVSKFFLRDVRCFNNEKEFNIRPLTFLIGENSTGKSTILGCFQAIGQYVRRHPIYERDSIDFNLEPFQMGAFENIVRKSRPKKKEFALGLEFSSGSTLKFKLQIILGEQSDRANPVTRKVHLIFNDGEIMFIMDNTAKDNKTFQIKMEEKDSKKIFTILLPEEHPYNFSWQRAWSYIRRELYFRDRRHHRHSSSREKEETSSPDEKQFYKFIKHKNLDQWYRSSFQSFSFSPIRSEPQRTYNPVEKPATSSGSEIPVLLRNLNIKKTTDWKKLQEKLREFGEASGLFTDIQVKNLGESLSQPFQLKFKIRNAQPTNLIDVGYGVSQILPILVRIMRADEHSVPNLNNTFLMQQPEVHLHPKAQAALTSLLAKLTKQKNNTFIIETHSDYMIDRARIEIRQGNIKPEDVSLIYLEAQGKDVEVYNLRFDKQANFKNDPPKSYRDFFLEETHKLLGW